MIDYGYGKADWPAPTSSGRLFADTLQAVRAHKPWPVLEQPGQADLTAHVDFYALAQTANAKGLRTAPLTTQGDFLQRLGLAHRLGQLLAATEDAVTKQQLETGTVRLVDPAQMGQLFKVLAVASSKQPPLPGLEHNQAERPNSVPTSL